MKRNVCFPIQNMKRGVYLWLPVAETSFRFSAQRNRNAGAVAAGVPAAGGFLSHTSLAVFAFSLVKIVKWEQQVYQQIMTRRPASRFSTHKNCNAGEAAASVPAAGTFYLIHL